MGKKGEGIGFSIGLKLEWLEQTAALVSLGRSGQEVRSSLQAILAPELAEGKDPRVGSRGRAIMVLSTLWVDPPEGLEGLRDECLKALSQTPSAEHLALHWAMAVAAYPFFTTVAESVGRLLRLQDTVVRSDVQRRVAEGFGDRPTVERATRLAIYNMAQWGALESDAAPRTYRAAARRTVGREAAILLIEAVLHASDGESAPLDALLHNPALFPFELPTLTAHDVDESPGLRAMSLGGAEATLSLAR
jgi:hypothetical protein